MKNMQDISRQNVQGTQASQDILLQDVDHMQNVRNMQKVKNMQNMKNTQNINHIQIENNMKHAKDMQHCAEIHWQHAVYTRKSSRESYTFSHAETTIVRKKIPRSLSVQCLHQSRNNYKINLETLRNATVLVLVTGGWAVHVSVEAFLDNNYTIDRFPLHRYDHLCRIGSMDNAECAELTKAYRALKYHCTMTNYEAGATHTWQLQNVVPMLSDIVILPSSLDERRIKTVMTSFCRAIRKSLKDSLLVAGDSRMREEML